MRRRLRLRDLPCLCRRSLAREGRSALADGRGHARLRLRRAAEFAAVLPDQGQRRNRRADGHHARTPGLVNKPSPGQNAGCAISTPRLSQGRKAATISAVSGIGLWLLASISTLTDCAEATHLPSENTTWSNVTDVRPNLTSPSPISMVPGQRSSS